MLDAFVLWKAPYSFDQLIERWALIRSRRSSHPEASCYLQLDTDTMEMLISPFRELLAFHA